jgi:hypothetical protein
MIKSRIKIKKDSGAGEAGRLAKNVESWNLGIFAENAGILRGFKDSKIPLAREE